MRTPLACLTAVLALAVFPLLRGEPAAADPFAQTDPFVTANAALARGDLAAAETLALPLTAGAAPRADACTLLGEVRLGQKRPAEAIAFFEKAAELNPGNATCYSQLGQVLMQQVGQAEASQRPAVAGRALAAFLRSVAVDPDHYDGLVGLAHFYSEFPAALGGDFAKAAEFAERVRKVNGFEGAILLGSIAERQGQLEPALARYREAIGMWAGAPELCACEARVLARMGRIAEARACYERIIKDFPQWEQGRQALAELPADPAAK